MFALVLRILYIYRKGHLFAFTAARLRSCRIYHLRRVVFSLRTPLLTSFCCQDGCRHVSVRQLLFSFMMYYLLIRISYEWCLVICIQYLLEILFRLDKWGAVYFMFGRITPLWSPMSFKNPFCVIAHHKFMLNSGKCNSSYCFYGNGVQHFHIYDGLIDVLCFDYFFFK